MTLRTAPLAQCITDERLTILAADDAYADVLGRPRAEILGRSPLDFTAAADRAVNDALLRRLDRDGCAFSLTKRYVRGDGALQWVTNHVSAFRDGCGPRRIVATCEVQGEPEVATDVAQARRDAFNVARAMTASKEAFGADVIAAPALEALLHLHLAEFEGRALTARCIGALIGQSPTIAVRWIRVLAQRDLIEVERDGPIDQASPLRITLHAQRMMDQIVGAPRPCMP